MKRLVFGLLVCVIAGPTQADLIAYYDFSGDANDKSGYDNHGTVYGTDLTSALTVDRFGNPNSAFLFDGVDDYISIGSGVKPSFPMTFSAWVYQDTADRGSVFGNDQNGYNGRYGAAIKVIDNGRFSSVYFNGRPVTAGPNGRWTSTTQDRPITTGEWHYLTAVFDGAKNVSLFVDGAQQSVTTDGTADKLQYATNGQGAIGRDFAGRIDDVQVYNTALSAADIHGLYNEQLTTVPIPPALLLFGSGLASFLIMAKRRSRPDIGCV